MDSGSCRYGVAAVGVGAAAWRGLFFLNNNNGKIAYLVIRVIRVSLPKNSTYRYRTAIRILFDLIFELYCSTQLPL